MSERPILILETKARSDDSPTGAINGKPELAHLVNRVGRNLAVHQLLWLSFNYLDKLITALQDPIFGSAGLGFVLSITNLFM